MSDSLDERYFPLILDVLDQGVFTVDEHTRISSFNRAAERITGYRAEEVLGRPCASVFETNLCDQVCPLRRSIRSRTPLRDQPVHIRARDGRSVPISVSTAPLETKGGALIGGVEVFRDLSQIVDLERRLDGRYGLADLVGKSPCMQRLFDLVRLVAASESTVLVTGASGTGKELVARTIHALGPRSDNPFVPVNCGAIPETLLESELFGHVRGAFTGAGRDRAGRVAAAEGGTLFLDEIGELPRAIQVKVLRFLQDKEYTPLGADRARTADVRLIAATNRDLPAEVRSGAFREDLFFRLAVIEVPVPALSERPEDVPLLIEHFARRFRFRFAKAIDGLTEDAMACLVAYGFPGNVRELENILERAFVLAPGPRIDLEHLPEAARTCAVRRPAGEAHRAERADKAATIRAALERHGGNKTAAAADLGMHRVTLHRWIRKLGL